MKKFRETMKSLRSVSIFLEIEEINKYSFHTQTMLEYQTLQSFCNNFSTEGKFLFLYHAIFFAQSTEKWNQEFVSHCIPKIFLLENNSIMNIDYVISKIFLLKLKYPNIFLESKSLISEEQTRSITTSFLRNIDQIEKDNSFYPGIFAKRISHFITTGADKHIIFDTIKSLEKNSERLNKHEQDIWAIIKSRIDVNQLFALISDVYNKEFLYCQTIVMNFETQAIELAKKELSKKSTIGKTGEKPSSKFEDISYIATQQTPNFNYPNQNRSFSL